MDLHRINGTLVRVVELLSEVCGVSYQEDRNDVDEFGVDASSRERLKMGKLVVKKKKPLRPMRTKLPYSLSRFGEESPGLRSRKY